jgi:CHASE3 domain sensor protein
MQRMIGLFVLSMLLLGLSGCSYLFYPRAGDYTTQAKGTSGVETMINLTNMMETTASKAKGGKGVDSAFDDLHNQFHALDDAFCGVTDAQAKTPAYDLAVTHKKELMAIFKRLWKFKSDQPQRDLHLDLLSAEVKELRDTLQTIK